MRSAYSRDNYSCCCYKILAISVYSATGVWSNLITLIFDTETSFKTQFDTELPKLTTRASNRQKYLEGNAPKAGTESEKIEAKREQNMLKDAYFSAD